GSLRRAGAGTAHAGDPGLARLRRRGDRAAPRRGCGRRPLEGRRRLSAMDFLMRSKLFVPASRPELFAKALASEADAISFDLEDAVEPNSKLAARAELATMLERGPPTIGKVIIVRVNAIDTEHFEADLEAVVRPG